MTRDISERRRRWPAGLEWLLAAVALIPIALFLVTSLSRLRYPFPLEQLEGPMLQAAERVAAGLPIYVRPNFHFIPYMYGPAYYYVSGWALRWLGGGFFPLRLISLLSTCASFALIYIFVLMETGGGRFRRHLAAIVGAGMYAAAYPWTREWFDLGRLDAFYVFLLLVALLCTRRLHPVIAAVAWTLTFLAKQTIFPVAVVMLCHDWKHPRRVVAGVASFVALSAASSALLNHATQGWFGFYAFTVPHANADLLLRPAVFYIPSQVLAPFGIALLAVAAAWVLGVFARPARMAEPSEGETAGSSTESLLRQDSARNGNPSFETFGRGDHRFGPFYLLAGASTFFLCWFLQAHGGASGNTAMPFYAVLAILFGISFAGIERTLVREKFPDAWRVLLLAAVAIPLLAWVYNPHDYLPHRDLRVGNQELVAWLHTFPGDVFLPSNPYAATLEGKPWHPDIAALHDALQPGWAGVRQPLLNTIRTAIDGEKFDAIAVDELPEQALAAQTWLPADLRTHYPVVGWVPGAEATDPFTPHPIFFLLPCRELPLATAKGWKLLQPAGQTGCPR